MPTLEIEDVQLHFDVEGEGYPVLLLAPGGMRSANDLWNQMPWNPRAALAGQYQLVGMDQRNAGRSTAPVSAADNWSTYAADQLAVLDHLGIKRCHVLGMCIGGPYVAGLVCTAPERFSAAVMLQPVGIDGNRDLLQAMFDAWADKIADQHPEADTATWESFRANMWNGEFVLAASPGQVAGCSTPMLVLMGDDQYHPQTISREVAALAPDATLVEQWKGDDLLAATDRTIKEFLAAHTPS